MINWNGTLEQLLWFDGLVRARKNHILAALATGLYELRWSSERLEGVLVKIR